MSEIGNKKRIQDFENACIAGRKLFIQKNREYGDSIRFGGVLAACYQIVGAAMRFPTLIFFAADHGRSKSEKLYDILLDIHNYANIAIIMLKEDNFEGRF